MARGNTPDDSVLFTNGIYKVGEDGKAQSGLIAGDKVVTGAGTYTIDAVNADGSYQSHLSDKNQTTANYTGEYKNADNMVYNNPAKPSVRYDPYRAQTDAQKKQNAAEAAARKKQLEEQKKQLKEQYAAAARQAYIDYMLQKKEIDDSIAQHGLGDSGFAEQMEVSLASDYGSRLSETMADKTAGLADLDMGIYESGVQRAKEDLEAEKEYAEKTSAYLRNKQESDAREAAEKKNAALKLIENGVISEETALAAGLTLDEAQAYYDSVSGKNMSDRSYYLTLAKNGVRLTDSQLEKAGITREMNEAWIKKAGR